MEINKIYNVDAIVALKELKDNSIDLVVTDCPYSVISGGTNSKWKSGWKTSVLSKNDGKIFEHNDLEFEDWIPEIYRVLKEDSDFYCMVNTINIEDLLRVARESGFKLHNILVWQKNTANANRWYMKNCEFTCYFYKGHAKTINNPGSKQVHMFPNPTGDKIHPTEKPLKLFELYIGNSSQEGDLVLDPFMGSGTTAIACKNLKRKFIGFEIDSKYYNICIKRIENLKENLKENVPLGGLFELE